MISFGMASLQSVVLLTVWAVFSIGAVALALWQGKSRKTATDRIAHGLSWVGAGATIVTGIPILLTPACV